MSYNRVILSGTFYGQVWQNVLFFHNFDGALTFPQVATHVRDNWATQCKSGLPADVFYTGVTVYDDEHPEVGPYFLPLSLQGSQSADTQLVPFACWVLTFRTALGGRHGHGRCFLPGVLKGFHFLGVLTAGGGTYWATALANLNTVYAGASGGPLHLVLKRRDVNSFYTSVDTIGMRSTMGAQRRRNIGVGI